MRVRNTKISQHRLGCRLPFECGNLDYNYATPGEVKTYYMSPEEIARRYGPPVKVEHKQYRRRLDKESLAYMLQHETVGIVARKNMIPKRQLLAMCETYGLELDEKGRLAEGVDDMARGDKLKAAKEVLTRDEFLELVNQGLTDKEVAKKKNLDLHMVKKLKMVYNLTGITKNKGGRRPRKDDENMSFEKYEGQCEAQAKSCEAEPVDTGAESGPVRRNIHEWIARRDELTEIVAKAQDEIALINKMFADITCLLEV